MKLPIISYILEKCSGRKTYEDEVDRELSELFATRSKERGSDNLDLSTIIQGMRLSDWRYLASLDPARFSHYVGSIRKARWIISEIDLVPFVDPVIYH